MVKFLFVSGRNHQYFDGTPIVYVDWLSESGTVLESLILKVEEGTANLSIPLSRDNGEGRFFAKSVYPISKEF